MDRWRSGARGRRRAVFGLALAAHVGLVALMLHARTERERRDDAHTVVATIMLHAPPRARAPAPAPAPASRVTRLRALARAVVAPRTITAPVVEVQAASAARGGGQRRVGAAATDAHARGVARARREPSADARAVARAAGGALGVGVAWRRRAV